MRELYGCLVLFVCVICTTFFIMLGLATVFVIINAVVAGGQAVTQPRLFFLQAIGFVSSGTLATYLYMYVWDVAESADELFDEVTSGYKSLGWVWKFLIRSLVSAVAAFIVSWLLGVPSDFKLVIFAIGTIIVYIGVSAAF